MSLTLHTILEGLIVGSLCLSLRFPEADPDTRFQVQVVCSWGFPGGAGGKEPACQSRSRRRLEFDLWVGKFPWRRKRQPTPGFLSGESHGQRTLVGYSP